MLLTRKKHAQFGTLMIGVSSTLWTHRRSQGEKFFQLCFRGQSCFLENALVEDEIQSLHSGIKASDKRFATGKYGCTEWLAPC
jgi:hypothetical protein